LHFHTKAVVSDNKPDIVQGRIDPEKVLSVMNQEGDLSKTIHYICGPTGLKESVKNALDSLNIKNSQVFSEDFQIIADPKEFNDIITRKITIRQAGLSSDVEVVKGKSILEAGLDAMLNMEYSCQTGNCMMCKGTLLSGQVKTIGIDSLPSVLKENERLLCCSYPLTDNVEISI
jgi:ring-1,2-phenylacetyl-CoA epoxidase subunit PaaE